MAEGSRTKLGAALDEERARILEELHRSQQRYGVLFDTAFAGIGITDGTEIFTLANSRPADDTARRIDVNDVAEKALRLARNRPVGEGPILIWHPELGLPAIETDPNELEQVLINLIDNAVYAAGPDGHVDLGSGIDRNDGSVALYVADDGPGIPDYFRERIFDPFFTTKQVGEGTGLGLAISYGIVQKSGVTIVVESVRRQGTRMTVSLPAASEKSR